MGIRVCHLAAAVLPVLLTPLLLFAIAEDWLNFGGGEKDLLLIIPYFIGASTFSISAIFLIVKKWALGQWLVRSILVSGTVLIALGLAAYITSSLGIA